MSALDTAKAAAWFVRFGVELVADLIRESRRPAPPAAPPPQLRPTASIRDVERMAEAARHPNPRRPPDAR